MDATGEGYTRGECYPANTGKHGGTLPHRSDESGLLADLYQFTVAQAYFDLGMFAPATFSLFIRGYPRNRGYFVSAGLEDVLEFIAGWNISAGAIDYLGSTGRFTHPFLEHLSGLRFTGEVWGIPEGRLFFCDEPVMEVTGPIIPSQIIEAYVINRVNYQTTVATKAARCVTSSRGRPLTDFSLRRAPGLDAGMRAARSSCMVGFSSTSNVEAGRKYGIPTTGTMSHSFVASQDDELEAFRAYARSYPDNTTLLIDTYDTVAGARKAALAGKELEELGYRLKAVRLDSGDYAQLSREVRGILDAQGLDYVEIFASGGLDEYAIDELLSAGAPIDAFGIGTRLGVSEDAPSTDMVYKLVDCNGRPVKKLSAGKAYLPGPKQVFRVRDADGSFQRDILTRRSEGCEGEPLLCKVMEDGKATAAPASLQQIRDRFRDDIGSLPAKYKALRDPPHYPVSVAPGLKELSDRMDEDLIAREIEGNVNASLERR